MATSKKNLVVPREEMDFWERHENQPLDKLLSGVSKLLVGTVYALNWEALRTKMLLLGFLSIKIKKCLIKDLFHLQIKIFYMKPPEKQIPVRNPWHWK